jgi:hypothetical protein
MSTTFDKGLIAGEEFTPYGVLKLCQQLSFFFFLSKPSSVPSDSSEVSIGRNPS